MRRSTGLVLAWAALALVGAAAGQGPPSATLAARDPLAYGAPLRHDRATVLDAADCPAPAPHRP